MPDSGFSRRLRALVRKEFLQLGRDRSSLLLGVFCLSCSFFSSVMGYPST